MGTNYLFYVAFVRLIAMVLPNSFMYCLFFQHVILNKFVTIIGDIIVNVHFARKSMSVFCDFIASKI